MQIQESGEMYLETILILSAKLPFVRSVDICEYMGYSKPSVSRAVGLLKSGVLIAGIVRQSGRIVIPSGNDILNEHDDVIVVTTDTTLQDIHDIIQQ